MKRIGLFVAGVLGLAVLSGCGETTACEKAGQHATHACYVEIHKEERETKEAEFGSLHAAHVAEHEERVEEELGEVENILKQRQAEETANALEGR